MPTDFPVISPSGSIHLPYADIRLVVSPSSLIHLPPPRDISLVVSLSSLIHLPPPSRRGWYLHLLCNLL